MENYIQSVIPFPDYKPRKPRAPRKEKPSKAFMEPDPLYKANVSLIQLSYISKLKPCDMPKVRDSRDAYNILYATWDPNEIELRESFKCMYMDRAMKVKAIYNMASGGITGVVADTRLMVAAALMLNATSVMLAHNHPSSNMVFSRADENLTQNAVDAFGVHDITVVDHLLIGKEPDYTSMADDGKLPSRRFH